jgi:TolB-like protein
MSLALLAIVAAGLAWAGWRALHAGTNPLSMARVEVASFQSLRAGDPDLARVSRATGDALVRVLRGADIPVIEAPRPNAGSAPDADFHLRGAVDRDGDATVINVQLLDRRGRNVVWSGRLERSLSAPTRFPDQAANRVGDILHCGLRSRAASNRAMTDAVLSLMLQACELRRVGPEEAPQFLAAAERLRAAAPQLSGAQSMYATAAAAKSAVSPDAPEAPALAIAARAAAQRALQLDPKNGEAYFAIGISYGLDRAWAAREANFLRAEALSHGFNVMADVHVGMLREVGRLHEARELNRRTVVDDPFGPDQLSTLIILTAAADGRDAAEPLLQRLRLVASPEDADNMRVTATFWWDNPKVAAALLSRINGASPTVGGSCLQAYLAALESPSPHRGLPDSCRTTQPDWRMRMLAREGDIDGAYRELAQARRGSEFLIALYYPEMRAFRADPRFMPLAARFGLVDYWTRTGHWPDFCTEPDRPYDCSAVARDLATSS